MHFTSMHVKHNIWAHRRKQCSNQGRRWREGHPFVHGEGQVGPNTDLAIELRPLHVVHWDMAATDIDRLREEFDQMNWRLSTASCQLDVSTCQKSQPEFGVG